MDEISIERARATLGDIVDKARLLGEATQINRYGKPAAVLVSAEWYGAAMRYIGQLDYSRHEIVHLDGDPHNNDPANLEIREKQ